MPEFVLTFKTDNEEFHEDGPETIMRILKKVREQVMTGKDHAAVFDINGNKIGEFYFDLPEKEENP